MSRSSEVAYTTSLNITWALKTEESMFVVRGFGEARYGKLPEQGKGVMHIEAKSSLVTSLL